MKAEVKLEPVKNLVDIQENDGKYTAAQLPGGERVFLGKSSAEAALVLAMVRDTDVELDVWPNGLGATHKVKDEVWEIWRIDPIAGRYSYLAHLVQSNGFYVEKVGTGETVEDAIKNAKPIEDDGDI